MDGFAVRSDEITPGTSLRVIGEIPAGRAPNFSVGPGEAVRIMTGAMMPPGADAVVPVEHTSVQRTGAQEVVTCNEAPSSGAYVRTVGSDTRQGTEVIATGSVVNPRHLGLLSTLGLDEIAVHRRPRVGICSTGDEIVTPGTALQPGQIFDANGPMLRAMLIDMGMDCVEYGIIPDEASAVDACLDAAIAECDVLLSSGGVSMGEHDELKFALQRRKVLRWHRIAIRPAKPLATARLGNCLVMGLPGNPVSAYVSFELFARPVLRALSGNPVPSIPRIIATAGVDWKRTEDGKVHIDRVRLEQHEGTIVAYPVGVQASHVMSGLAGADGLVLIPDGTGIPSGSKVEVLQFQAGEY